jgi:hypothetical protein
MKQFKLSTKLGVIHARVNGINEIMVNTTRWSTGYPDKEEVIPVTIRGKQCRGNVRFGWNGQEWDGRTYAHDGNTVVFVDGPEMRGTEYAKGRACYLNLVGGFGINEATSAAKVKFYDTIKAAVNEFYTTHRQEIDNEIFERRCEVYKKNIESLEETCQDLDDKLGQAKHKLLTLRNNPPTR